MAKTCYYMLIDTLMGVGEDAIVCESGSETQFAELLRKNDFECKGSRPCDFVEAVNERNFCLQNSRYQLIIADCN